MAYRHASQAARRATLDEGVALDGEYQARLLQLTMTISALRADPANVPLTNLWQVSMQHHEDVVKRFEETMEHLKQLLASKASRAEIEAADEEAYDAVYDFRRIMPSDRANTLVSTAAKKTLASQLWVDDDDVPPTKVVRAEAHSEEIDLKSQTNDPQQLQRMIEEATRQIEKNSLLAKEAAKSAEADAAIFERGYSAAAAEFVSMRDKLIARLKAAAAAG